MSQMFQYETWPLCGDEALFTIDAPDKLNEAHTVSVFSFSFKLNKIVNGVQGVCNRTSY